MIKFKDKNDREWTVPRLSLGAIEHFEESTGQSFFEVAVDKTGTIRVPKAMFLIGLLYSVLAEQLQREGIGFSDFRELLDDGMALASASNAMGELLQGFFQRQNPDGKEDQANPTT